MGAAKFPERPEGSGTAPDPRKESLARRADRNVAELIQELRVVSLGVQVLFGFLLSLPFTVRFSRLSAGQRDLYLACLVLSAVATVLLLGPVAYHRIIFRRGLKESLVRYANVMAILGLVAVGAAVLTAVLLVTSVVAGTLPGALITAIMACLLVIVWFALPLARREDELRNCCAPWRCGDRSAQRCEESVAITTDSSHPSRRPETNNA